MKAIHNNLFSTPTHIGIHMVQFSEAQLLNDFSIHDLDHRVENCCRLAAQDPISFYILMQRYTHFNGYAGPLVTRLASSIGISRELFKRKNCDVIDEQDIGCEIANKVFCAAIDEYGDHHIQASHRTAAQATLRHVGRWANLSTEQRNAYSKLPDWMQDVLARTIDGYQGAIGDFEKLIFSMGFHASSEILAHHEYQIMDRIVRHELANTGFDAYIKTQKNERKQSFDFYGHDIHPWFWVSIHGNEHGGGVEKDHFDLALDSLNMTLEAADDDQQAWVEATMRKGFQAFCDVQTDLFNGIEQECLAYKAKAA
jgi:hypothetical protein